MRRNDGSGYTFIDVKRNESMTPQRPPHLFVSDALRMVAANPDSVATTMVTLAEPPPVSAQPQHLFPPMPLRKLPRTHDQKGSGSGSGSGSRAATGKTTFPLLPGKTGR